MCRLERPIVEGEFNFSISHMEAGQHFHDSQNRSDSSKSRINGPKSKESASFQGAVFSLQRVQVGIKLGYFTCPSLRETVLPCSPATATDGEGLRCFAKNFYKFRNENRDKEVNGFPPGWYAHTDYPNRRRWWNGSEWEDKWQEIGGEFRVRFIENGVDGSSRTTDLAQTFVSQQTAEAFIQDLVNRALDGKVPDGCYFEVFSINAQGVEESYGKWLGKRFARIGVAAAIGTALGLLLGG
jgi:hypothetical protein